jgi:hypothetical protein
MCKAPQHYQLSEDLVLLNEYKTNATGSGFENINKFNLSKSKPKHWAQVCQYGAKFNLKYCLYMIENKNDSDIIIKIIELDWKYGLELEKKAEAIINSKEKPPRISDNPAFFSCKYCHLSEICHNDKPVEINCRSCRFAEPIENAKWKCHKFQMPIPDDFIKQGCEHHVSVN